MSERTRKVASLVQQIVAAELIRIPGAVRAAVTGVDVTPDLRYATIWIGILGPMPKREELMKEIQNEQSAMQAAVARGLSTKFVPRIAFKLDVSGDYADRINQLIRGN